MAKLLPRVPYVRLRQRGDDRVLHITNNGSTHSGELVDVGLALVGGEVPIFLLDIHTGTISPFGNQPIPTRFEISADRILACDVAALNYDRLGIPGQQLKTELDDMAQYLIPGPEPACLHENVIDVTALDDAQPQGMCAWCGGRMVAELHIEVRKGPWRPA